MPIERLDNENADHVLITVTGFSNAVLLHRHKMLMLSLSIAQFYYLCSHIRDHDAGYGTSLFKEWLLTLYVPEMLKSPRMIYSSNE